MDSLVRKRAGYKSQVTIALKSLRDLGDRSKESLIEIANEALKNVKACDRKINDLYQAKDDSFTTEGEPAEAYLKELDDCIAYESKIKAQLSTVGSKSSPSVIKHLELE